MIPSLTRSTPAAPRHPEWPEPTRHWDSSGTLFEKRPALRRLIVMVDAELAPPIGSSLSPEFVLSSLLTHPYVKLYRYSDDDAFPVPLHPAGNGRSTVMLEQGWATIYGKDGDGRPQALIADDEVQTFAWMPGNTGDYARRHTNARAYSELSPTDAAIQREKDGLALQVAAAAEADIYVTKRPYLFELPDSLALGVTICHPESALALLALYLRAQGEFTIWRRSDGATFYMGGELHYWVGVRELLPSSWRWYAACIEESYATGDAKLKDLAETLLIRMQRGLQARDDLHLAFNRLQNPENSREVLAILDTVLVLLMSAVDITARVAHNVLSLSSNIYLAGWQKSSWRNEVSNADANLASFYVANSPNLHALTILRLLRNTVHGQAIRNIPTRLSGGSIQTDIQLPADAENDMLASMDALGGRADWGASTSPSGVILINPSTFIERLWPEILRLLNETMVATPVERLSNVNLAPADCVPPPDSTDGTPGTFDEANRNSIRWQLGF
jgi:hypothetical protein